MMSGGYSYYGYSVALRLLITLGKADVNYVNTKELSCVWYGIKHQNEQFLRCLVRYGAKIGLTDIKKAQAAVGLYRK